MQSTSDEFERFTRSFSNCPLCGRANERKYLKAFFTSTEAGNIVLKNALMDVIDGVSHSRLMNAPHEHMMIGIPCCSCYNKAFMPVTEQRVLLTHESTSPIAGYGDMHPRKKFVLKIVTAGDNGCGKDVLLHRFVSNRFIADTSMTIGVQYHLKNITFGGVEITLQLWDFGGQERFRFLLPTYASGAKGFVLFFDLTRMQTTFSLENSWLPIVRKEDPNLPGILVGTKLDLVDHDFPAIDPCFGSEFIASTRMQGYVESSSKSAEQVDRAFHALVKAILDYNRIPYDQNLI